MRRATLGGAGLSIRRSWPGGRLAGTVACPLKSRIPAAARARSPAPDNAARSAPESRDGSPRDRGASDLGQQTRSAKVQGEDRPLRLRQHRRERIREFDQGIRGIVRIAQGMSRLAGREDLGKRFRPILSRTLRKLEEEKAEEGAGSESGEAPEGTEAEPSQVTEEAASEETSA